MLRRKYTLTGDTRLFDPRAVLGFNHFAHTLAFHTDPEGQNDDPPPPEGQDNDTPPPEGDPPEDKDAEIERLKAAAKKHEAEAKKRAKRLAELEAKEEERRQEGLSELEREKERAEKAEQRIAELEEQAAELAIGASLWDAALTAGANPARRKIIMASLERDGVTLGDEGVTGAEAAVQALKTEAPELFNVSSTSSTSSQETGGNKQSDRQSNPNDKPVSVHQQLREKRKKTRL